MSELNENELAALQEKVISKKAVFDGVIIHVEHWQVELPDGRTALREIAVHPGAAAVVALDDEKNLILVHQARVAVERVTLELPAGKLDSPDEDPLKCAQRELSEETGMSADHWEKLTVIETTFGFCNERIHLYLATGLHEGTTHMDDEEFVSTVRIPLDEMVDRVMQGEIHDAKTLSGVMIAAQHLRDTSL